MKHGQLYWLGQFDRAVVDQVWCLTHCTQGFELLYDPVDSGGIHTQIGGNSCQSKTLDLTLPDHPPAEVFTVGCSPRGFTGVP